MKHRIAKHDTRVCGSNACPELCRKQRKVAIAEARAALRLMHDQEKWRIEVTENLGWHWSLRRGWIEVNRGRNGHFYVFAVEGPMNRRYVEKLFADPNLAVLHFFQQYEDVVRQINNDLKKLRRVFQ